MSVVLLANKGTRTSHQWALYLTPKGTAADGCSTALFVTTPSQNFNDDAHMVPPFPDGHFVVPQALAQTLGPLAGCVYGNGGKDPGTLICPGWKEKVKCFEEKDKGKRDGEVGCREEHAWGPTYNKISHRVVGCEF
jgi:hypothetical protein